MELKKSLSDYKGIIINKINFYLLHKTFLTGWIKPSDSSQRT